MSKVDLLTIYPDQTHTITKAEVAGDRVKIPDYNPKIVPGKSVFPERLPNGLKKWGERQKAKFRKKRRLVIWLFGCDSCYTMNEEAGQINDNWNSEEAASYIDKIIAWAAAKIKIWSTLQVYLLFGAIVVNLILSILVLRRVGI